MSQLVRATASALAPVTPSTPSSVSRITGSQVAAPVTPAAQTPADATPSGAWKHPRFDEIARRQNATNFDERNVRTIFANGSLLLCTVIAPSVTSQVAVVRAIANPMASLLQGIPFSNWIYESIRLMLVANILVAVLPLLRRRYPDDLADIPLTPSQRLSMGLKADNATPQTSGSAYASPSYVTPPRYQRSTPRASFSASGDRPSQSPLTGSPKVNREQSSSNSPFSPGTGSPLFREAVNASSASKGLSYSGSPLGNSLFADSSSSATPGTPTPSTGKASVGLNSKWLYEKRRDSPRSNMFH